MNKKSKRRQWHKENKTFVFDYFKGICQVCFMPIGLNERCDIHHLVYSYKGKLYDTPALELIQNNIITLVCRSCHVRIHTAVDDANPQHYENTGHCDICGILEKGIFDRKRTHNLDRLLCRNCYKSTTIKSLADLEKCENCGKFEKGMSARINNGKSDRKLCQRCFENGK